MNIRERSVRYNDWGERQCIEKATHADVATKQRGTMSVTRGKTARPACYFVRSVVGFQSSKTLLTLYNGKPLVITENAQQGRKQCHIEGQPLQSENGISGQNNVEVSDECHQSLTTCLKLICTPHNNATSKSVMWHSFTALTCYQFFMSFHYCPNV